MWYDEKGGVYNQGPIIYQQPLYQQGFDQFLPYKSESSVKPDGWTSRRFCVFCIVLVIGLFLALAAIGLGIGLGLYGTPSDDQSDAKTTDTPGSATTPASTASPLDTFSYVLSGRVTINDDTNWPYITQLANQNSAEFTQYEDRFCNEVEGSQYLASLQSLSCRVAVFSQGSLHVDFVIRIAETKPSDYTQQYLSDQKLQAAVSLAGVFVDGTGSITHIPSQSIQINEMGVTTVTGVTSLGNMTYTDDLADPTSQAYLQLEQRFCDAIVGGLESEDGVTYVCVVQAMTHGSVRLLYTLTRVESGQPPNDVVPALQNKVNTVLENTQEFEVQSSVITDVTGDVCDSLNCDQICNDEPTIPRCECNTGYDITTDGHCEDIDECSGEANGGCDHNCVNTEGSFECTCRTGFVLDPAGGATCVDQDECDELNGGCDQTCQNTEGSFECSCGAGFGLGADGLSCLDVNECESDNGGCADMCENTEGSFACGCQEGSTLDLADEVSCIDIDECESEDSCQHECRNTEGSYICSCFDGYQLTEDTCIDVDECEEGSGTCEQLCVNTEGAYQCTCHDGFTLEEDGSTCSGSPVCMPWQFACSSGPCVNDTAWCNGSSECPDDSDEPLMCRSACPPNQLQCGDRCIQYQQICDGVLECQDWSDESGCACDVTSQRQCDMGMCIDSNDWCDDVADCPDESDESSECGCVYVCDNGYCLSEDDVCDGYGHCGDFSDEKNCECTGTDVACGLGPCIADFLWCNGNTDCLDGSDEVRGCPSGCPETTMTCNVDFGKFRCLRLSEVCDGIADCYDGLDEIACNCSESQCHWGMCIGDEVICDTRNNCFDWSDEINCFEDGNCPPGTVQCDAESVAGNAGDRYCVRSGLVCDGMTDCPLGEDESEAACAGTSVNQCREVLEVTESGGYFTSPNYPDNYFNDLSCIWNFTAPQGFFIRFYFEDFFLEESTNFCHDLLEMYEDPESGRPIFVGCGDETGRTVESTGNFVQAILITDNSQTYAGFNITYTAIPVGSSTVAPPACTEEIAVTSVGQFTSAGYPENYEDNTQCLWILTAPEGERVQVTFSDFAVEPSEECTNDLVAIFDGHFTGTFENLLFQECGVLEDPEPVVSSGNVLSVGFLTNEAITDRGFVAIYSIFEQGDCIAEVNASMPGNISSPGFPDSYNNSLNCVWTLRADPGYLVSLRFTLFDVEWCPTCSCDLLTIRDGDASSDVMWSGCSTITEPFTAVSSSDTMTVTFSTDSTAVQDGFYAEYSQVLTGESSLPSTAPPTTTTTARTTGRPVCGSDIEVADGGFISSPGYPDNYDNGLYCVWNLTADEGQRVALEFMAFHIERCSSCSCDQFLILDGGLTGEQIWFGCGFINDTFIAVSSGNTMIVIFYSDVGLTYSGFYAQYSQVNTGESSLPPPSQSTTTTSTTTSGPVCSEDIMVATAGSISSPGYPNDAYPNSVNCVWTLIADEGYRVSLQFTHFEIEYCGSCTCDEVMIEDGQIGATLLWRGCGTITETFTAVSSGNILTVHFLTDRSVTRTGFLAEYSQVLTGESSLPDIVLRPTTPPPIECTEDIMVAIGGNISSPFHPDRYPNDVNCTWTLIADEGYRVSLQFTEFDLEYCSSCRCDEVKIEDEQTGATLLWRGCGTITETFTAVSSGNILTVHFVTDGSVTADGFIAEYSQVLTGESSLPEMITTTTSTTQAPIDCSLTLSVNERGTLTSPGYPIQYQNSLDCEWTFFADDGYHVNLTFLAFSVEHCNDDCPCDRVEILEENDLLWYGCGLINPFGREFVAISSGQNLTLTFSTDGSLTDLGFALEYSQTTTGETALPDVNAGTITTTTTLSPEQQLCRDQQGFLCQSGNCIEYYKRCDSKQDCEGEDSSDEEHCQCNPLQYFSCADTPYKCISIARRCDGTSDCADHSDEWHCNCTEGEWLCESENRCFSKDWQCDGEVDCRGGADEEDCGVCAVDEYQCSTSECIASTQRCDGTPQCKEGTDEAGCLHLFSVSDQGEVETRVNPGVLGVGVDANNLFAVCATNWAGNKADLACKQLGFVESSGSTFVAFDSSVFPNVQGVMTVSSEMEHSSIIQGATFGSVDSCSMVVRLSCEALVCGRPRVDPNDNLQPGKVVNGDVADRESWPWMVSLHHANFADGHICGGTLINEQWIVTAAHCIVTDYSPDYTIHIGSSDVNGGVMVSVEDLIIHPDYSSVSRREVFQLYNDIALIKLTEPVEFDGVTIMPICLPQSHHTDKYFSRCYVTGWGQYLPEKGSGSGPRRLRQGKLSILPPSVCSNFYLNFWETFPYNVPYKPPVLPEYHVCAGQDNRFVDACYGDSGGPLNCQDEYGNWFLYGTVSFGPTGDCVEFSIYERVSAHVQWIQETIQQHSNSP